MHETILTTETEALKLQNIPSELGMKQLNFKTKPLCIFKSVNKITSASSSFQKKSTPPSEREYIIIDDDDNEKIEYQPNGIKNNTEKHHSNNSSPSKSKPMCNSKMVHSDEDCFIIEKEEIDFKSTFDTMKQKKTRLLDFKNKNKDFLLKEDNFPPIFRKTIRKRKHSFDNLLKILAEISNMNKIKISEMTLNTILSEISHHIDNENVQSQSPDYLNEVNDFSKENEKFASEETSQLLEGANKEPLQESLPLPIEVNDPLPLSTVQNDKAVIRVAFKYQAKLPFFNLFNRRKEALTQLEKAKVWETGKLSSHEIEECRKLVQNILRLNNVNEEILCELLAKNNYKIQDTVKYCFDNSKNLQAKIIEKYLSETHSNRRTRNSLYNKFLLK